MGQIDLKRKLNGKDPVLIVVEILFMNCCQGTRVTELTATAVLNFFMKFMNYSRDFAKLK
jgi:hypothetical protein